MWLNTKQSGVRFELSESWIEVNKTADSLRLELAS